MKRLSRPCILAALLVVVSTLPPFCSALRRDSLTRGSSLSVEDDTDILVSQDESFACGFYKAGSNAYAFSIWFANSANATVAWTANRDQLVNGRGSRITLQRSGRLALTDFDGTLVWSSNTSSGSADRALLLNTGNLVVVDADNTTLWQSFDSPTDTLLPMQPITKSTPLVSASASGLLSSGYYRFYFDTDNVLRLIYDGPDFSSIYWPNPMYNVWVNGRTSYNSTRYGVLDEMGHFYASDQLEFNASDYGHGITRRLTLDFDGNLRLYSLSKQTRTWSVVSWQAVLQPCDVHGTCGRNGLCVYSARVGCTCPPGFEVNDPSDWTKGCRRKHNISCHPHQNRFLRLPYTDFWGFDLNYTSGLSFGECRKICSEDCSCEAFGYKQGTGECYPKTTLFNGRSSQSTGNTIYMKLARNVGEHSQYPVIPAAAEEPVCNGTKVQPLAGQSELRRKAGGKTKWEYFYGFVSAFFAVEALFIASGWWFIFRREKKPSSTDEGYQAISSQFRRFTYAELKRATRDFKDVVGTGGSGAVYKAALDDERVVAVKKLEDVIEGEEEFKAELNLIGRIYHKNLVRMFGFCSERSHRLLVSEFVENGSLDKALFGCGAAGRLLRWSERYQIGVGVAKGLAYLHHECLEWVIHCDVKPENILLDQDWEPKIADFGLAKLLNRGGECSNPSRIRGTRGYIAPEWASSLPINGKVDVYSYGVVLLELVKGETVSNWVADGVEEEVSLVLRRTIMTLKAELESGEEAWIGEFVDHRLEGEVNWRQAMVMMEIAFACVEEERNRRPTMDSVVQMLLSCDDEIPSGGRDM
ncbi:putative receptor protein kinase ZmPK1 [Musa acuminata AAA Group]|uniref:putative receptor protein kinase ZmPK1 n=1 Tax=Musa acuminata AAA Group TaxID=214697 RepID=UPI0031E17923